MPTTTSSEEFSELPGCSMQHGSMRQHGWQWPCLGEATISANRHAHSIVSKRLCLDMFCKDGRLSKGICSGCSHVVSSPRPPLTPSPMIPLHPISLTHLAAMPVSGVSYVQEHLTLPMVHGILMVG